VPTEPLPLTGKETGIDVGLQVFLIPAEGDVMENPRPYRKAARALQKAQQRVSRRKKGRNRRKKAVKLLARKHQQVRRQRCDLHHKTARALVRHFAVISDVISLEDLPVRNLSRRPAPIADGNGGYLQNGAARKSGRNKSIQDAGWYAFRRILAGKAAYAGKRVEALPPAFTTQDCSNSRPDGTIGGERVYTSLSVRTQVCPSCGLVLDRDENAARTIQWAGQALRGVGAVVPAMAGALNREAPSL
jgi:putative transposase